jgi:AcrR family transcriptional regulator
LARHLSISKKTLYKHFKDKNDIVIKGMELHHKMERCAMDECFVEGLNAIDENFEISKVILDQLQNIHPSVMYDLEKYYPEALSKFDDYKNTVVRAWVESNLKKGIEEGLFRKDLNIPILTTMYLERMDLFLHTDIFPAEYSPADIYLEIFRYHIRGIASEEGVKYLKEKIKKELQTK